jgi:hypothetical protein
MIHELFEFVENGLYQIADYFIDFFAFSGKKRFLRIAILITGVMVIVLIIALSLWAISLYRS